MKKKELKSLSHAELVSRRDELNRKYMDLRFQLVIGHVDNPLQKRNMRREIAAVNTLIRQNELSGQGNK
ncbi:MAG: 50S ribosomal protein L29 [Spirochaetales bacterium]|nr:50S ribosomal protein L29 [Spirochaetales bacterium]HNQ97766.1 50S ribosomal protein L29 [Treponemataceae bacterium]